MRRSPLLKILPISSYNVTSEGLIALIGSTRWMSSNQHALCKSPDTSLASPPVLETLHQDMGTKGEAFGAFTSTYVGASSDCWHQPLVSSRLCTPHASDLHPEVTQHDLISVHRLPSRPFFSHNAIVDPLPSSSSPSLDCSWCPLPGPPRNDSLMEILFSAAAPAEQGFGIHTVVQSTAHTLEWVHTMSGLPWWASIPLCTLAMRLVLMPISLRQAKIVRTSYMIYREALELTDRQMGLNQKHSSQQQQQQQPSGTTTPVEAYVAPSSPSPSPSTSPPPTSMLDIKNVSEAPPPMTASQRLKRSQAILQNFSMLRKKCDAPHPIWIVVNPLLQVRPIWAAPFIRGGG